jgi:acetolactate synthase-1/2/3 large subunit
MLQKPEEVFNALEKAIEAATTGRKGPAWIDIPLDLQSAHVEPPTHAVPKTSHYVKPIVSDETIEALLKALREAERPVVLIGSGVRSANAETDLRFFIERWRIPLTYAASAPDSYGSSHNLSVGSVGAMGCSRAGNFTLQNADLVLVLGCRLTSLTTGPDYCKFARAASVHVVDIDPLEHSKNSVQIDNLIQADLKDLLVRLNQASPSVARTDWLERVLHWKRLFAEIEPAFQCDERIDLYTLANTLSAELPRPSTLVTDSGLIEVILPTNIRFSDEITCIHPVSQGAMGFALPAAVGAYFASPKTIVAVVGDGSIMMNLQELETIRHHQLPIKILIVNNNVYSIIRRRQRDLFRKRIIGTDPSNGVSCPDFSKVAESFGFDYLKIERPSELSASLHNVLNSNRAVICEIMGRADQGYIEVAQARSNSDGRHVRRPLEDQAPFLPREIFLREMIVDPIDQ